MGRFYKKLKIAIDELARQHIRETGSLPGPGEAKGDPIEAYVCPGCKGKNSDRCKKCKSQLNKSRKRRGLKKGFEDFKSAVRLSEKQIDLGDIKGLGEAVRAEVVGGSMEIAWHGEDYTGEGRGEGGNPEGLCEELSNRMALALKGIGVRSRVMYGRWAGMGHFWNELEDGTIVDISADQFNSDNPNVYQNQGASSQIRVKADYPPVYITSKGSDAKYSNGKVVLDYGEAKPYDWEQEQYDLLEKGFKLSEDEQYWTASPELERKVLDEMKEKEIEMNPEYRALIEENYADPEFVNKKRWWKLSEGLKKGSEEKPRFNVVSDQIIIEKDPKSSDILILLPNGEVWVDVDITSARNRAKAWAKKNGKRLMGQGDIGAVYIVERGTEGLE
jgi:hypothetical protein